MACNQATVQNHFKKFEQVVLNINVKINTNCVQSFVVSKIDGLPEFVQNHPKYDYVKLADKPGYAAWKLGA